MGKRELLLAATFIILGVSVYRFTAPPVDQSRPRWSVSGMVQQMRRHVGGSRASATATTTTTVRAPDSLREMRIVMGRGNITVLGEDRTDIQVDLNVTSSGYDAAEADGLAKATTVKFDEAGALLIAKVDYPEPGQQRSTIDIRVPRRLGIRIDEKNGVLKVSHVASVVLGTGRGESHIANVAGAVQVTQRGSTITVTDVSSLRLTTLSGAEVTVARVHGDANFTLQGGQLRAEEIDGAIEVEARNTDVRFAKLEKNRRALRVNATNGEVVLAGVQTEARIDGHDTDIRVDLPVASTLSIYNEGDESIELTAPANGFTLDAVTTDGRLTVDAALEKAGAKVIGSNEPGGSSGNGRQEFRAAAAIRGGGPTITLRASRGDIVLRSR